MEIFHEKWQAFSKQAPRTSFAAETQQEGYRQEQQEKKDGMSTGLKVTFGVILGLVIAAVAAGILSKTERQAC